MRRTDDATPGVSASMFLYVEKLFELYQETTAAVVQVARSTPPWRRRSITSTLQCPGPTRRDLRLSV